MKVVNLSNRFKVVMVSYLGRKTMRKLAKMVFVLVLVLSSFGLASIQAQQSPPPGSVEIAMVNPGFEGDYVTVPGGYAARGWTTHFKQGTVPPLATIGGASNPTRRPEFKPILASQYPDRVVEGEKAQVAFAFYGIMDAAFSQQIKVSPGVRVQWALEGEGWSTNTDNPNSNTGDVHISMCIGPEGQTDPWAHGVVCRRYDWTGEYRTYTSREVVAESDTVTLIVLITNKWALKHNDGYLDASRAWYVPSGTVETPTPVPTYTPYPTPEPCPTCPVGQGCDYTIIRGIVREELADREPVHWPR